jgi:ABC-type amino acid transport substrate-binding protein
MRRSIVFALIAALLAGLLPLAAEAQSTLAEIKKRDKLVVGVKTDFPPFGTIDASGGTVISKVTEGIGGNFSSRVRCLASLQFRRSIRARWKFSL